MRCQKSYKVDKLSLLSPITAKMSGIYNHRPMVPAGISGRVSELLEAIKAEFDSITQDTSVYKLQRDEFEHKSRLAFFSFMVTM